MIPGYSTSMRFWPRRVSGWKWKKMASRRKSSTISNLIPEQAELTHRAARGRCCLNNRERGCFRGAVAGYGDTLPSTAWSTANQVQHMPSFGRDVFKLAQLAPGVFGDGSQGGGGGRLRPPRHCRLAGAHRGRIRESSTRRMAHAISANGQQTRSNGVTIDGISTASAVWGGTTVITPIGRFH